MGRSLAGPTGRGTSDCADEVTLSLKGAKSRTRITGLRSKTTNARTPVDRLRAANADLKKKLADALEQQTATSEVLQVISSSPGELEPVFQAMLANAVRICEAKFGNLYLHERGALRVVASHNVPRAFAEARRRGPIRPAPGSAFGKLIRTKQTVEIADVAATRPYAERDPAVVDAVELGGVRTGVVVPMLKNNDLVGAIAIFRAAIALVALDGMTHSPGRRPAGPLSEKSSPTALGPAGRTPRPVNSEH